MQALSLDAPCLPAIPADAEAGRCRGDDDIGASVMSAYFVHVFIDVDRWMPSGAAVRGPRNAADMNVRQECGTVGCRGHGPNSQWWTQQLAVYERGSGIPCISPRHASESG